MDDGWTDEGRVITKVHLSLWLRCTKKCDYWQDRQTEIWTDASDSYMLLCLAEAE